MPSSADKAVATLRTKLHCRWPSNMQPHTRLASADCLPLLLLRLLIVHIRAFSNARPWHSVCSPRTVQLYQIEQLSPTVTSPTT
jgi:hypothetical protein